jgi:AmmeMemoRadiSam system protein A
MKRTGGDVAMLSEVGKTRLLEIARQTLEIFARTQEVPSVTASEPELLELRGVFVTLKKEGRLRGCVGFLTPHKPLFEAVQDATVAAAIRDPRFAPVTDAEVREVVIDISALSPMERVTDFHLIQIGTHGLLIRRSQGHREISGLLLPQVASEHGWSREEFLRQTCLKAGLAADAWHQEAEVFSFTAEVFGEKDV